MLLYPRLLVASSLGHGRCPGPDSPIPDSIAGINVPVDEVESVHYSLQDRSHDEARCIVCLCLCVYVRAPVPLCQRRHPPIGMAGRGQELRKTSERLMALPKRTAQSVSR
ncbi:hypothetical protein ASPFODRAFT_47244 [Aspergillus luchuensis CBS 106.47]|uniref:Uncharacterized protein n=1 Tax=Aspergillus luchuensis (strain CBS 106.47) TaxID=1137211 RepID=A0A1M3THE6_ASPLC|nr:hypothetical protein ASPFODRAFT_47244 [Aspergillus luchuensis CBS 106.47]